MSDIVKHLRSGETCAVHFDVCPMMNAESGCLCAMAADTIEAYRAEVDRFTFALSDARMEIATLKATQAELVGALVSAKGWVSHWQADVGAGLLPTGVSLASAALELDAAIEKARKP